MEDPALNPRLSLLPSKVSEDAGKSTIALSTAIKELFIASFTSYLFMIFERMGLFVNVYFMSRTNDPTVVAALGFGNTWIFICGIGLNMSFCYGMATLISQANGANQHRLCSYYLHKGSAISLLLFLIFLVIVILYQ